MRIGMPGRSTTRLRGAALVAGFGQDIACSAPDGADPLSCGRAMSETPKRFEDKTLHPLGEHVVEALRGKRGLLTFTRLAVDFYEREEYLLFSDFDDGGVSLVEALERRLTQHTATESLFTIRWAVL